MVEGRFKGEMEEADKEKALKQVAEASLNEKTLELNSVHRRVTTAKKARQLAKTEPEKLQAKLSEPEVRLAEVSSIISARDKELAD